MADVIFINMLCIILIIRLVPLSLLLTANDVLVATYVIVGLIGNKRPKVAHLIEGGLALVKN